MPNILVYLLLFSLTKNQSHNDSFLVAGFLDTYEDVSALCVEKTNNGLENDVPVRSNKWIEVVLVLILLGLRLLDGGAHHKGLLAA